MSEQQFSDLVAACEGELQSKQELFQHRIEGCKQWRYNLDDCTLTIDEMQFDITPIGTYSSSYGTWLWGWANEDFPAVARNASKELLAGLHQLTGWQVFHDPGIHASPADAVTFSALAVHMLDGTGLFRDSAEDGLTLYLAVQEHCA